MKLLGFRALIPAILLAMALPSASHAVMYRTSGDTSLSVYGAYDKQSEEPGLGLAMTKRGQGLMDLSATAFKDSIVVQSSQLKPLMFGMLPIHIGMTAGYAFSTGDKESALRQTPEGFLTGLQVVFTKAEPKPGLSVDLRASSLTKGVNPVKWVTDPDMLWVGAGLNYSF